MKLMVIGVLALAASGGALADTTMYGVPTCADWLKGRVVEKAWLIGYLSGLASMDTKTRDVLHEATAEQDYLWLDNYCREHPLEDVANAGSDLYIELRKRQRAKPSTR